jgi:hypothetical protein
MVCRNRGIKCLEGTGQIIVLYADIHRGIALGFVFNHRGTGFPVRYERERAQLDYKALTNPDKEGV